MAAGNAAADAAADAALAAQEAGATVAMVASAPQDARAGNSAFTGGAFRFVSDGVDDLLAIAPDIKDMDSANRFRLSHARAVFR